MTDSRILELRAVIASVGARTERLIKSGVVSFPMRSEMTLIALACEMAIEADDKAEEEGRKGG